MATKTSETFDDKSVTEISLVQYIGMHFVGSLYITNLYFTY